MNISVDGFLTIANAFELGVSVAAMLMLGHFVFTNIGLRAFFIRIGRALRFRFEGDANDLAIAVLFIFIGKTIRTEAVWSWRLWDGELDNIQVSFGILVATAGALCLIRILAPDHRFNLYWLGTITFATVLTVVSYWYS